MKKALINAAIVGCALLALSGCQPRAHENSPDANLEVASKLSYFKDKHGLCYAAASSFASSYDFSPTVSITLVPCEKVGLAGEPAAMPPLSPAGT